MTLSQRSKARVHKDFVANPQTYQVGAHFKALNELVLMAALDSKFIQVGFNLISVQVCILCCTYTLIAAFLLVSTWVFYNWV